MSWKKSDLFLVLILHISYFILNWSLLVTKLLMIANWPWSQCNKHTLYLEHNKENISCIFKSYDPQRVVMIRYVHTWEFYTVMIYVLSSIRSQRKRRPTLPPHYSKITVKNWAWQFLIWYLKKKEILESIMQANE